MSSIVSFSGAAFGIQSVTQIGASTLRVVFTQDPLAVSEAGANDATNPANWTLTGPASNTISGGEAVIDNPQAVDLTTTSALVAGDWTLTVAANVTTDTAGALSAPLSGVFQVASGPITIVEALTMGAEDEEAGDLIRKHLNPALKGVNWDAVIAALAVGEERNRDDARAAYDMLFKCTSAGMYLDRLAADSGVARPLNMGMSDELFREYAIKATNGKLTEQALLELLECFYGPESVHAYIDSTVQNYAIYGGWTLDVLLDGNQAITITFEDDDFADPGDVTAAEAAAALTRGFVKAGSTAVAVAITNPETLEVYVRIYSGTLGLGSSVVVTGGRAQNKLQFDTYIGFEVDQGSVYYDNDPGPGEDYASYDLIELVSWDLVYDPETGRTTYTMTWDYDQFLADYGQDYEDQIHFEDQADDFFLPFNISTVQYGDYVNIYGSAFAEEDQGTFTIVDVRVVDYTHFDQDFNRWEGYITQSFTIEHETENKTVTMVADDDVVFFRPSRKSIYAHGFRNVSVASLEDQVDITMPATSALVGRDQDNACYLQEVPEVVISSIGRTEGYFYAGINTVGAHGLSVGDQIIIDKVTTIAESWDSELGAAGVNGYWTVLYVYDSDSFAIFTPKNDGEIVYAAADETGDYGVVIPLQAQAGAYPGPYLYDPDQGFVISEVETTITQELVSGRQYAYVDVVDASDFPDEACWLVFAFGYENQAGPVKCLGKISSTRIQLDFNHHFLTNVDVGAVVTVLEGKGPFDSTATDSPGAFWLTASTSARVGAEVAIDSAVAAGVNLNKSITYPGDRGLGGEGHPASGASKLSDKVMVWGGDDIDDELAAAREEE